MTCLALMSDLHLDTGNFRVPESIERADACVLAGDIGEAAWGSPVAWAKAHIPSSVPTYFVPGNHDFYGGRVGHLINTWRQQAHGSHVHVLVNQAARVGEARLLGTPLWSGLHLANPVDRAWLMRKLKFHIADFSCILGNQGQGWSVEQMLAEHETAMAFLAREMAKPWDGPTVVATHWPAHKDSISPNFRGDPLNAYFVNHLPELVAMADVWLHGHVHDRMDYVVESCRTVCNPRGYPKERERRSPYEPVFIDL